MKLSSVNLKFHFRENNHRICNHCKNIQIIVEYFYASLVGIAIAALPASIITAGYMDVVGKDKNK